MAKCTVLVGSGETAERVEIPENSIGRVQIFLRETGHKFTGREQLRAFISDSVVPAGVNQYRHQSAAQTR